MQIIQSLKQNIQANHTKRDQLIYQSEKGSGFLAELGSRLTKGSIKVRTSFQRDEHSNGGYAQLGAWGPLGEAAPARSLGTEQEHTDPCPVFLLGVASASKSSGGKVNQMN